MRNFAKFNNLAVKFHKYHINLYSIENYNPCADLSCKQSSARPSSPFQSHESELYVRWLHFE